MTRRSWKICGVLVILGALSGFLKISYGLGFLLGAAVGILLYWRNSLYWNDIVDGGIAGKGTGVFHFTINYLMMAVSMLAGVRYPAYLNIYATALGLTIIKMTAVTESLIGKE